MDGGKSISPTSRDLAKLLAGISPKIEKLHVVICTHSDSDHSNGLWDLADDWKALGRKIVEFWLPGRWANAVPAILTDPVGFVSKLYSGAIEASFEMSGRPLEDASFSREARFNKASERFADKDDKLTSAVTPVSDPSEKRRDSDPLGLGLSLNEILALLAANEETDDDVDLLEFALRLGKAIGSWFFSFDLTGSPEDLNVAIAVQTAFHEVAETATAIQRIAAAALKHEIPVRWFNFGEYKRLGKPSGGIRGLLQPCCLVEVVLDRDKAAQLTNLALFHSLRLSRQNVESIVFYRPESLSEPGVLIVVEK